MTKTYNNITKTLRFTYFFFKYRLQMKTNSKSELLLYQLLIYYWYATYYWTFIIFDNHDVTLENCINNIRL